MITKLVRFIGSLTLTTKIAVITTLCSLGLSFAGLAFFSPKIMFIAAGLAGFAAGFSIHALRDAPRGKPPINQPPVNDHPSHPRPQPVH